MNVIYIGNDMVAVLDELKDVIDNTYLNDAVVDGQFVDDDGDDLWDPIEFVYVPGSNGTYRGRIPFDLDPVPIAGKQYQMDLVIDAGDGLHAEYGPQYTVVLRR